VTLTMYGIKNCDTIEKARRWLEERQADYTFHDYKAEGAPEGKLRAWVKEHGWETVLNRKGTTFRALPDADKQGIDADKAVALMLANPSMIKRPVLELPGGKTLIGFDPELYDIALKG
jgi:arsenate reductase (glutaredoxin)